MTGAAEDREPPDLPFAGAIAGLVRRLAIPVEIVVLASKPGLTLSEKGLGEEMVDITLLVGVDLLAAPVEMDSAHAMVSAQKELLAHGDRFPSVVWTVSRVLQAIS